MTAASQAAAHSRLSWWRTPAATVLVMVLLVALLSVAATIAVAIGAAGIPVKRIPAALGIVASDSDPITTTQDHLVLWSIRLPRIAMTVMIGALLAVSGAVMQGLFRNPLADPALFGVSSGGALAAAAAIVMGDRWLAGTGLTLPVELLPAAAFFGALAATLILYRIATRENRTSIAIFLLGGLAIAALANAGIGLLVFTADDRQLRDITFWLLGSMGGATWLKASVIAPFAVAMVLAMPLLARGLDRLVLGEAEAFHMGVDVERLKRRSIVLVSAMTGAAVAFVGVVGFVGIVVPHLLRLLIGPRHGLLLPSSACLGAALLLVADVFARTMAAPAEVPIGVLTALVGAPFFLAVLMRQRRLVGL